MKKVLLALAACIGLALVTAAIVVRAGLYDVSATREHTQLVYSLLETTMRYSVQRRAHGIAVPSLASPAMAARGAACYRDHCAQCHGGPGAAPDGIGKSMQPLPGFLIDASTRWRPQELYLITRDGIKMSGMPAWGWRLGEHDLWSMVAFLERMPELSPAAYAAAFEGEGARPCVGADSRDRLPGPRAAGDRSEQARVALHQYGCIACHAIPGITGSQLQFGPPLDRLARRGMLAGRIANTPENLVRLIKAPRSIDPQIAMPDMGVPDEHARLIADYLLKLQ